MKYIRTDSLRFPILGMIATLSFLSADAIVADDGTGEFRAYTASKAWTPPTDPAVLRKLQEWQGLKFGVLLDWQACTQWGIDSWQLCPERYAWNARKDWVHCVPEGAEQDNAKYKANYEVLKKTFRPTALRSGTVGRHAGPCGCQIRSHHGKTS